MTMSKHSISERENALRVLTLSAEPQWVPVSADCFMFLVPSIVRERPVRGADGEDWFGCNWIWDADSFGFAPDIINPPLLEDINKWREVMRFPDLDSLDWKSAAETDLAEFDRSEKLLRIILESGPFERTHQILGFESAFIAMCEEPEEYKALIDAITDYKIKLIDKVCEFYKPDEIMAQDDLGTAKGPMISIGMYRDLLKPAHNRIGDAIRSNGVIYTHHSCGRMEAFIDDIIETGVHAINPFQPMNDLDSIARKYAGVICCDVGAETLANYPSSSEKDIRAEVRRVIDTFGPHKNLMIECFPSNVKCMHNIEIALDEARRYGSEFYTRV
jgi:uroporphyrinogen decarboxylase